MLPWVSASFNAFSIALSIVLEVRLGCMVSVVVVTGGVEPAHADSASVEIKRGSKILFIIIRNIAPYCEKERAGVIKRVFIQKKNGIFLWVFSNVVAGVRTEKKCWFVDRHRGCGCRHSSV